MPFHTHLRFVQILLCLLSLYQTNACPLEWPKQSKIVGFSWHNCGAGADPFIFNILSLSPDPIKIPGDVTVNISITLAKPFPPDVTLLVIMEKKIAGFYIKVPCIDNVGSCIYHNVCTNSTQASPDYFKKYGLSGKCPSLPAGIYSASNVVEYIAKKLPAGAGGDFRITVNPLSGAVGQLGCIQVQLNLSD